MWICVTVVIGFVPFWYLPFFLRRWRKSVKVHFYAMATEKLAHGIRGFIADIEKLKKNLY